MVVDGLGGFRSFHVLVTTISLVCSHTCKRCDVNLLIEFLATNMNL